MKLLILTQKINKEDSILGFFHNWVYKLSFEFESITVICLEKGEYDLPNNVRVSSLGKEKIVPRNSYLVTRFHYIWNFYKYIWQERNNYDAVFVHMNQEYVLLGGLFWQILGKKVFMWRNHQKGSIFTRMAVFFSERVFYTAPNSYTAKFSKAVKMPVGVDTAKFIDNKLQIVERKNKILSLGRISPVKNIHIMIEAAKILKERNVDFVFDIVGEAANPEDFDYIKKLENSPVNFMPAVPNYKTPEIYSSHEIFVNLTESFDKTIIEAAACGSLPIIVNKSLEGEIDKSLIAELSAESVAGRLEYWLKASEEEKERMREKLLKNVLENHSLDSLINKLLIYLK